MQVQLLSPAPYKNSNIDTVSINIRVFFRPEKPVFTGFFAFYRFYTQPVTLWKAAFSTESTPNFTPALAIVVVDKKRRWST